MSADPAQLLAQFKDQYPDLDPEQLVQMNVRLPRWLVWAVDQRRSNLDLSRDRWVARALRFAIGQPGQPVRSARTVARTSRGRTANTGGGQS